MTQILSDYDADLSATQTPGVNRADTRYMTQAQAISALKDAYSALDASERDRRREVAALTAQVAQMQAAGDATMERQMRRRDRRTALVVAAVAIAAAVLSFTATSAVARDGAVKPAEAWLVPIAIEGAMFAALEVMFYAAVTGRRRPKLAVAVAGAFGMLTVSLNVAHATGGILQRVIAGAVPVSLFCSAELAAWLRMARRQQHDSDRSAA